MRNTFNLYYGKFDCHERKVKMTLFITVSTYRVYSADEHGENDIERSENSTVRSSSNYSCNYH